MLYRIGPNESVCVAVVCAVATAENRDPASLPPLNEVVDTDSLDALFAARTECSPRRSGMVAFQFGNSCVTVSNNYVSVEPQRDGRTS